MDNTPTDGLADRIRDFAKQDRPPPALLRALLEEAAVEIDFLTGRVRESTSVLTDYYESTIMFEEHMAVGQSRAQWMCDELPILLMALGYGEG